MNRRLLLHGLQASTFTEGTARIRVISYSKSVSFPLRFVMGMIRNRLFGKRSKIEPAAQGRVLRQVVEAKESGDLLAMRAALVAVNQWLGQHGFDWAVLDARDDLRRAYRVKGNERRS